jgi:hypothetical protein
MLVVYSSGPIAGNCVFERFGFTNTLKRIAFCFLDEGADTVKDFFVRFLPIDIIAPGMV